MSDPLKFLWRAFAVLVLTASLTACAAATPTPTPIAATPETIVVTDALGRTLRLDSPPQRIVIAGRANVLLADALYIFPEAADRVVGLVNQGQNSAAADFLRLLDPDLDAKMVLARDASAEQIAALHPDLVVMKRFLAGKLGRHVKALGVPVFYLQMETPEQYVNELRMLGVLLGNPAHAEEAAAFYQDRMAVVQKAVASVAESARPRVLLLQHTTKGGTTAYRVPAAQWLQTALVRMGGGVPVWAGESGGSGWMTVTLEQIVAWNPDQVFVVDYFGDPVQAAQAFSAEAAAQHLKAMQNHRVMAFPKDFVSWDQPDARWVLGLLWLAKQMQPEATAAIDLRREVEDFYRTVYGLDDAAMQAVWERLTPYLPPQP